MINKVEPLLLTSIETTVGLHVIGTFQRRVTRDRDKVDTDTGNLKSSGFILQKAQWISTSLKEVVFEQAYIWLPCRRLSSSGP